MSNMTTWEYASVPVLAHSAKAILDTWGSDGWELVSVLQGESAMNLVAYFKRPLQKDN